MSKVPTSLNPNPNSGPAPSPLNLPNVPIVYKDRFYVLFYHYRASNPQSLVFQFTGTFMEAVDRGRLHCKRVGYRFIKVRPHVVDLDEREQRILDGIDENNL